MHSWKHWLCRSPSRLFVFLPNMIVGRDGMKKRGGGRVGSVERNKETTKNLLVAEKWIIHGDHVVWRVGPSAQEHPLRWNFILLAVFFSVLSSMEMKPFYLKVFYSDRWTDFSTSNEKKIMKRERDSKYFREKNFLETLCFMQFLFNSHLWNNLIMHIHSCFQTNLCQSQQLKIVLLFLWLFVKL